MKKSAFICSVIGFVFGILSILCVLVFTFLIFSWQHDFGVTITDDFDSVLLFLFSVFCLLCIFIGYIVALILGIISVVISKEQYQLNPQRALQFGICDIVFAVSSVVLRYACIIFILANMDSIFSY